MRFNFLALIIAPIWFLGQSIYNFFLGEDTVQPTPSAWKIELHKLEKGTERRVFVYQMPGAVEKSFFVMHLPKDFPGIFANATEPAPQEIPYIPMKRYYNFIYYSRSHNNGVPITYYNTTKEIQSIVNPSLDLKVIVHGWSSSAHAFVVNNTVKEFLAVQDVNAVEVDWSDIASNSIYPASCMDVWWVGYGVSQLVSSFLFANVTTLGQVHLIGHSLGAHVVGVAGNLLLTSMGGKVARITGLDPAGPLYNSNADLSSMLDPSDAEFVDVIHTSGRLFGHYGRLGHADFYPNGGTPLQPGCLKLSLGLIGCSHARAYKLFDESISNPKGFKAVQCSSWQDYEKGSCANNKIAYMGNPTPPSVEGVYFLKTNDKAPFAKG